MIDVAEILPFVCVLLGFVAMVLVARYRRDLFTDDDNTVTISQVAHNIPMERVDSPYTIGIAAGRSTLKDGVAVRLQTNIRCQLRAFWFVNIQRFYAELDARDFRLAVFENRFLQDNCVYHETYSFEAPGDYSQRVAFSDADRYVVQSDQTRREYPLVLIVHRLIDDDPKDFFELPVQIATLHVQSSVPKDPPTKFLGRFSKLANGQSLVLQDIYAPGAFASDDTCAVCLTERITHVLLPCKHACVCQNCFSLMDKCPICQNRVISYFQI